MTARAKLLVGIAGCAVTGAIAVATASHSVRAQDAPESLLPPGFDQPAPTPTAAPTPTPAPRPETRPGPAPTAPPAPPAGPVVQPLPPAPNVSSSELGRLPTLEELENLSTDQLDERLGLKPKFDIPPAARRSLTQVGLLAPEENGFATRSLARQPADLVRATLSGIEGPLVSRWGHILLRRALASRLEAPEGLDPVEFAALRVGVLNTLGEFVVARAMVQDVDTAAWGAPLTREALDTYIALSDITGACPAVRLGDVESEGPRWTMLRAICNAYAGESALAGTQLDRALGQEIAPAIDVLLAQRFAGAAGRGRRGVAIEWDGVDRLTPWRYALANAVGEPVPEALLEPVLSGDTDRYYALAGAAGAMLPIAERAVHARTAAAAGVLSSNALVDLYSQVYAQDEIDGDLGAQMVERAAQLREAYVAGDPAVRIEAMQALWDGDDGGFAGQVLTARAAARIPPRASNAGAADALIASMLTAGLDRDAAAWREVVEVGSLAWALIALADPGGQMLSESEVDAFLDEDGSSGARKSAFLIAGLAGIGRLSEGDARDLGGRLDIDLTRNTRWTRMIARAAEVENPALVAMLAGLGMQGESWAQMTPLHLYHITAALTRVGLEAEARMIAAEAVARG